MNDTIPLEPISSSMQTEHFKKCSMQIKISDYCSEDSVSIWTNGLLYINISLISWTYKVIVFKSLFPSYIYVSTMVYTTSLPYKYNSVTDFSQLTAVVTTSPRTCSILFIFKSPFWSINLLLIMLVMYNPILPQTNTLNPSHSMGLCLEMEILWR